MKALFLLLLLAACALPPGSYNAGAGQATICQRAGTTGTTTTCHGPGGFVVCSQVGTTGSVRVCK